MAHSQLSKASAAVLIFVMMCCSASGQLIVAGCAGNSCNPSAKGGTSISTNTNTQSTTVEQPAQASGGNPIVDLLGGLGPFVPLVAGGGRKLMGHQVAAIDTTSMRQLRQLPTGLPPGAVIVAGCAGNSCNPTATGGRAISTSQTTQSTEIKQAPQQSGGDPFSAILKPFTDLFGGRRLMGVQDVGGPRRPIIWNPIIVTGSPEANCVNNKCNPVAIGDDSFSATETTQHTTITTQPQPKVGVHNTQGPQKQAPGAATVTMTTNTSSSSSQAAGGSVTAGPQGPKGLIVVPVAQPGQGLRRLQCIERNLAECRAWGPSQCGMPGVNDKCPCMCGGLSTGASTQGPQGPPVIIINQETTTIGCKDGSCNPNAQGGNAGR